MSDGKQLLGSSAHTLFYEAGKEEGHGALMHTEHLSLLLLLLSCLPSTAVPLPVSLASHEPVTMIDPTSNSNVTCKSIYVPIYYPYQIHTDVFLHLPFSYRQSVLMVWWRTLQQDGNICK